MTAADWHEGWRHYTLTRIQAEESRRRGWLGGHLSVCRDQDHGSAPASVEHRRRLRDEEIALDLHRQGHPQAGDQAATVGEVGGRPLLLDLNRAGEHAAGFAVDADLIPFGELAIADPDPAPVEVDVHPGGAHDAWLAQLARDDGGV